MDNELTIAKVISPNLKLYIGYTFFKFTVTKNYKVANNITIAPFIKNNLIETEWNPRFNKWIITASYCTRDSEGYCRMPIGFLNKFKRYLLDNYCQFEEINIKDEFEPNNIRVSHKRNTEPRENQLKIIEFLSDPNIKYKPLAAQTASGKMERNSNLIRTPEGWVPIGNIKVGDQVFSRDGSINNVIGVFPQGKQQIYRVSFKDGRYLDVGKEHLWTIIQADQKELTVTTDWILNYIAVHPGRGCRLYIPLVQPLQDKDVRLLIHPYLLGVILGDGGITTHSIHVTTDEWICDKISNLLPPGCRFVKRPHLNGFTIEGKIIGNRHGHNPLRVLLSQYGFELGCKSEHKFIPDVYMYASHQQRLELLQGLMDTDGYITDPSMRKQNYISTSGSFEYSTSSRTLAYQFVELIYSIGGMCIIRERIPHYTYKGEYKAGLLNYRIHFRLRHPSEILTIPRKKERTSYETQYTKYFKLRITRVDILPEKDECTCIMVDHPSHTYVSQNYVVTHNTFMAIYSIVVLGLTTFICLNGLINQWYKSLLQFTTIRKEDIYVIQGFEPLRALWEMFNNGYRPKVIIASARTIYMYISEQEGPYTELPTFEEMQRSFGIGIAIHDEVHMNFCTNTKIDLYTNVRYNIYLSATYMRNNMQSRKIFNTVFPPSIVYGALNANIVKYTKVIFGKYILHLNEKERNKCIKQKGYSHAVYEGVVLKNSEAKYIFFQYILKPIIDMYYIQVAKPKQKCLVLCWTKDMCIHVYDYLKTVFRDKKVTLYFSGSKSKEGNEKNLDKDIIVSTEKSCGTGRDIKGLKTCINTISIASEPLTRQIFGRLRQIPGEETIFIDMWNREMSSHYHHYRKRLIIYRDIATSVFETSFN